MSFYMGTGKRLSDADFISLAKEHDIPEHHLRAVNQVEARNSGFYRSGALKCLYEPHLAYRYSRGTLRNQLVKAGVAYKAWKKSYPKSSFPRIDKCTDIAGAEFSARCTSWGLGQILGSNYKILGYSSALDMVADFAKGEKQQLEGIIKFVSSNSRAMNSLRKGNWASFARYYNGSGYKKNKYDSKLKAAADRWEKIIAKRAPVKPEPIFSPTKPKASQQRKTTMNTERITGFIRHVLTFAGGFVVAQGYVDEQTMMTIVGGLTTLVGAVWSWVSKDK